MGLALQGTLSNVAAGVMILIFRPYQVGDMVILAGRRGMVRRLDLFNTELMDPEGLRIIVPNGKGFGDMIVNESEITRRRVELSFPLDNDQDFGPAAEIAIARATVDPRVLKDPAPWAKPTELSSGALTLTLRAWVSPIDHGEARSDLLLAIKSAFDEAGVQLAQPTPPVVVAAPSPSTPALGNVAPKQQA